MATNKTCLDRQPERKVPRSIAAGASAVHTSRVALFFAGYRCEDGRSRAIRARFGVFVWISRPPSA